MGDGRVGRPSAFPGPLRPPYCRGQSRGRERAGVARSGSEAPGDPGRREGAAVCLPAGYLPAVSAPPLIKPEQAAARCLPLSLSRFWGPGLNSRWDDDPKVRGFFLKPRDPALLCVTPHRSRGLLAGSSAQTARASALPCCCPPLSGPPFPHLQPGVGPGDFQARPAGLPRGRELGVRRPGAPCPAPCLPPPSLTRGSDGPLLAGFSCCSRPPLLHPSPQDTPAPCCDSSWSPPPLPVALSSAPSPRK